MKTNINDKRIDFLVYILTNYADGDFSTMRDTILLDGDAMLLERSLSTVLCFLASVRIFQTRNDTSATGIQKKKQTHYARSL